MRQLKPLFLLAGLIAAVVLWQRPAPAPPPGTTSPATSVQSRQDTPALPAFLPQEARLALDRIARGGPFPHQQDGVVFGNYESLLPKQPRGYYHEYTVETPGAGTRGARRIITGGTPPQVWYYTNDHYRSFRRFEVGR